MRKQSPKLDWQIVENDAEWERQQALLQLAEAPVADRRGRRKQWVWRLIVLFLLLALAADWWRQTASTATRQAQASATVVAQALAALPHTHIGRVPPVVEFDDDQAVLHIITAAQPEVPPYRQTFFFRHTQAGWQRTAANTSLWGPEQRLLTAAFLFHFRQRDAAVVRGIAPQLDALYATLGRNFGLPVSPAPDKLVVEVSVEQAPGQVPLAFDAQQHLRVASPALYRAPVELTDTDLLAQAITLPLLRTRMTQARAYHAIDQAWQPLLHGLVLWQLWDTQLPLAAWRTEIVQWLYGDLPRARLGQPFVLPKHYAALCTAHQLWLRSPTELNLPLMCTGPALEEQSFALWLVRNPLTRLDQFTVPRRPGAYGQDASALHAVPQHPAQTVALATLIEYAVATYGRARLPVLLAGLGQYESWATLIPAVYGVSPAAFERGWQAYLAAHYALALDPFRK